MEGYVGSVKNTLSDSKLGEKFSDEDKTAINTIVSEIESWLESNTNASKTEYEAKYAELGKVYNPIITKVNG